ncbi:hypothetical protein GO491_09580 [Flavobacteriaceae bacterium Ap0902]|nr:hypothetical protein [Flavobacteriaceae bacterium Ap0902]
MDFEKIYAHTIIKELPTEGHSPLLVVGSNYKLYVAKNDKGKQPPYSIINELFASFCFENWKIDSPKTKIIEISKNLVSMQEGLSIHHKPYYYDTLCFGSEYIQYALDINNLFMSDSKKTFNKLRNHQNVFHITLFDTWVENDDRKPTNYNMVLQPIENQFIIIPIDNAFIFSTMSYTDLNPEFVSVSSNDHLLVSELGHLIKKFTTIDEEFIKNERKYFYLCIENCRTNFDNFISNLRLFYTIDDSSVVSLKNFLFNDDRNNKVFEEYVYRLSQ